MHTVHLYTRSPIVARALYLAWLVRVPSRAKVSYIQTVHLISICDDHAITSNHATSSNQMHFAQNRSLVMATLLPRAQNLHLMLLKIFNIMYLVVAKLDVF